jgi:transcriptional regulator with XRE-family HTH domain
VTLEDLLAEQLKNPEFRSEWERLAPGRAISEVVIAGRIDKGLSQTRLAKLMGVSQPVIARIESGEHSPTLETLIKLANALDIEIVIGISPANRETPTITTPHKRAKRVREETASRGSHLVVSAA